MALGIALLGEQTGPDFLTGLLKLENTQQQTQIAEVDLVVAVELFSQALSLEKENISGLNQVEENALSRISQMKDELDSTQIKMIQTLCLKKLSSLDAEEEPKLKEELMNFLNTTKISKKNLIEMVRYAHANKSMYLLQKCLAAIGTSSDTTLTCGEFGPVYIKIGKHNDDCDIEVLNSCIPFLTAAVGQDNVQIELVAGNSLSIETLTSFVNENSKSIQTLDLREKQANDVQLKKILNKCTNLNRLFIKSNIITGEGLQDINNFASLQTLVLSNCKAVTSLNLAGLTNLQTLNLWNCGALTSLNLTGLTSLEALLLMDCKALTSLNLATLSNLRILDLRYCKAITSLPDFDQFVVGMKCLSYIYLPDIDKLTPKIGFLLSFLRFRTGTNNKKFFCEDLTQVQKDRMIQYWMREFVSVSGASSSSSASQSSPDNLNKLFETYNNAIKSSNSANPPPTLGWMQFALLRLAALDESARQWVLDKAILDVVLKFQNPTARYPIAEAIFRVAENSKLRTILEAKKENITKDISGRRDLKALIPYLIVALEGRGVGVSPLQTILENLPKTLLADSGRYGIIFTLFTNLYFLEELDGKQISTLIKAIYTKSLSQNKVNGGEFLTRCSDISTLIGFAAFDKLRQEKIDIVKAVEEVFTDAVPVEVENLITKFNKTYAAWRNPFAIMAYASKIKSLDDPVLKDYLFSCLCNMVTATVEDQFSEFRYDLERVPDLKAIDSIDPEFVTKWKNASKEPCQEWSPSDSAQIEKFDSKVWLTEKLVEFKHVVNPELTEYILQFLEGNVDQQDKVAQELTEKIRLNKNDQTLRIQDLCIQLCRTDSDEENTKSLKLLSKEMKGKEEYADFLNDIKAVLSSKGEKKEKYVIYVTDHPSDLLNIGEMGGSCQNVFNSSATTNQGVLGSSSTGTFQLVVMKSAHGPAEKSVSRILIHAHPHGDEIAVYAERLYDDTKLQGVEKALMDYAKKYVESRGAKCVLVSRDLGGTYYGPLKSMHSGPPVYVDSAKGIQRGDYTIPDSYRY